MGMFDWLTGTKRPADGVPPRSPHEVYQALLAVNRPTAPYVVRPAHQEGVDLVAEWKIVDASWYAIFSKAGLKKVFRVLMRFDPAKNEVRSIDQEWSVSWNVGVPTLSLTAEFSRGQSNKVSFGTGYAFTEEGQYGEVYSYKFSSSELKTPLKEAVTSAGWTWRGLAFGKL
ncbi:hypothetical protein GIY23_04495 [Allosaccharopolyspora coralli]|uniref:Uncharacterized protein n=1 Tax=Allosaccharopolyspora coralli TaxID=2665642 RepID=A0A5Q3Q2T1_9PSEU|nr:hypothetical protein [Allosaccharopolyspora coralli]QGK68898.1 hypothetical protein GIY23_04495 [Allosaccharopolyspora coralli]